MIYHIKRFKPTNSDTHYRTIIEESDNLGFLCEVRHIYGWVEPNKVVGYEATIRASDIVSALERACELFQEHDGRQGRKFWRDELGRVEL